MHIAIVTAGGAGMFCGSCMHDNTWARALRDTGHEVTLIPTYTPIRVDEENLSSQRVFFGGINVYLEYHSRLWRRLPRWMTRWVDHPKLISLATRFAVSNDAGELGELTLAMLDGESGPQAQDVEELATFIGRELKPDVVCFSNALLAGAVRRLRGTFDGPILCVLQGDDIFIESLSPAFRSRVISKLTERAADFDGFVVHSDYYRDHMAKLLSLSATRFRSIPLGISFDGHVGEPRVAASEPFRIGYFARVCPEKGLHLLVDAVKQLRRQHPALAVELVAGGFLGTRDATYFEQVQRDAAPLGESFRWAGSPPDHESKVDLLCSLDVLCVPTVYREPKGLYALEALANGVPVVLPAHGAFPQMIDSTGGGLLFDPQRPAELTSLLARLIMEPQTRVALARAGYQGVRNAYSLTAMTDVTLRIFREFQQQRTGNQPGKGRLEAGSESVEV
ncbi:glycosyltransferase [bacterium]|nr:glycosyltransferase [bacterium]